MGSMQSSSPAPVRARVSAPWLHTAILGALALGGCANPTAPLPQEYQPAVYIVEDASPDDIGRFQEKGYANLDDVHKPVLFSAKAMRARKKCNESDQCRVSTTTRPPHPDPVILRYPDEEKPDEKRRGEKFTVLRATDGDGPLLPKEDFRRILLWRATNVHDNDVDTPELDIGPGDQLRFATGIQTPAWHVDSAPVEFIILGEQGGNSVELFREKMDPRREPRDRGWKDHVVSLAPLEGTPTRFRFLVRPVNPDDPRPQLPLWGDPAIWKPVAASQSRPWVILVSLDTLRAQSMSSLGYEIETSPRFSQLARRGTLFTTAYSVFTNTTAHHGMHTGRFYEAKWKIRPEIPTLAEALRAANYATAAFTENAMLIAELGIRRGFSTYAEDKRRGLGNAKSTFSRASQWVEANRDSPGFLFVHTYAVHFPYDPAAPYDTMFATEFEERNLGEEHQNYEREIRELDDDLAKFLQSVRRFIPEERLLLIVTSDHGEEFLEHGHQYHFQPYDEVLWIPLLFSWPDHIAEDRRVETPVSLADILPTTLALLDLPPSSSAQGVSLAPLLASPQEEIERTYVRALGGSPSKGPYGGKLRLVARSRHHKCISRPGLIEPECFDLRSDPAEENPIPLDSDPIVRALAAAVGQPDDTGASPREPLADTDDFTLDPERRQKLQALGYVDADLPTSALPAPNTRPAP